MSYSAEPLPPTARVRCRKWRSWFLAKESVCLSPPRHSFPPYRIVPTSDDYKATCTQYVRVNAPLPFAFYVLEHPSIATTALSSSHEAVGFTIGGSSSLQSPQRYSFVRS
jgi:hypothetical protein